MGAKPDSKHTPLTDTAIYEVPVDALTPYPGNPRVGNTEAIAESLKANGQYRPIIVRRETREILAGNHTWRAARALRWDTIKVTYLDGITDQQAAKIVLADNRLPDLGRYNTPDLTALIEQVSGDLTGTGYDPYFVQNLLTSLDSIETIPIAQQNEAPASQGDQQTEPAPITDKIDAWTEWEGMPEYASADENSAFRVTVNFRTSEDADAFFAMLKKPRSARLWWPDGDHVQRTVTTTHVFVGDDDDK